MYLSRYLENPVKQDINQKMVFIFGPRQSEKTTLAKKLLADEGGENQEQRYLNWDSSENREKIIREEFPASAGILILDEIHKYSRWRQVVKGLYDTRKDDLKIIVTGSSRLDYYRHGGDSLQGRYHSYRLRPFSVGEIKESAKPGIDSLIKYGGFPEPFMLSSER